MWETDKQVNTDILELQMVFSAAKKTQRGAEVELKTPVWSGEVSWEF